MDKCNCNKDKCCNELTDALDTIMGSNFDYLSRTPFYNHETDLMEFGLRTVCDRVLLYPLPPEERYNDGLIEIPVQYQEFYQSWQAIVLAVGPGYYEQKGNFVPTTLKVGSLVLFNKDVPWYSTRPGVDGKEHAIVLCGERDVWIVYEG